jgi:hypothetical protein
MENAILLSKEDLVAALEAVDFFSIKLVLREDCTTHLGCFLCASAMIALGWWHQGLGAVS